MVWLFVIGLGVWAYFQSTRISGLERRIDALAAQANRPPARLSVPASPPLEPEPKSAASPSLVALLAALEPAPDDVVAAEMHVEPAFEPEPLADPEPAPARPPGPSLAAWLSENGLAWLGGGGLALGGLFMVTYAAQRGVFTPALRIVAALVLGGGMLAASEWIRRLGRREGGGHALAAAATAGAGAATLYGAVWAAERLYHFIDLGMAAPILAAISASLLGLALLHGAPLALLALGGAFLAPVVTGQAAWSEIPLTLYLVLITATAYGAAALRRWGSVALAAGLAAAVWATSEMRMLQGFPAALLLLLPPVLAAAAVAWRRPADSESLAKAPAAALAASSLLSLGPWMVAAVGGGSSPVAATLVSAGLALVAGAAAARRLIPPPVQATAYAAAVLAALVGVMAQFGPIATDEARLGVLAIAAALTVGGFVAAVFGRSRPERLWAGSGAVAAGLVFSVAELGLRKLVPAAPWLAPAAGAGVLALAAWTLARRTDEPERDLPLALWVWSATAVALQALGEAFEPRLLPAVFGLAAVFASLLQARLRWRGLASSALAAALAAFTALLGHDLAGAALAGRVGGVPAAAAVAAGLVYGSAWIARRARASRDYIDGLSTAALVIGLAGAFLTLRALAAGPGQGPHLDPLTEAGLRAVLLLVTGLLSVRGAAEGPIARWRPQVLLGLALAHTILVQALGLQPIWSGQPVIGPPIVDSLAVAFLAPALLFAAASRPRISPDRRFGRLHAVSAMGLGLIWALLEIRRLCQGVDLAPGLEALGRVEGAADAVVVLAAACGLAWRQARPGAGSPKAADAVAMAAAAALIVSAVIFGWAASPWWGPITRPLSGIGEAALLGLLYAAGVAASFGLARLGGGGLRPAARVLASLQLFVLVTLVVRFAFRGPAMGPGSGDARLETWSFSAVWALYGLAVLILGVRRSDVALRWTGLGLLLMTTAKVVLFDMARLDGLVRAGSFLAVGALLLVGALAARRLGAFARGEGAD